MFICEVGKANHAWSKRLQSQDKVGKKQGAEQLVVNAKKSKFEETW